VRQGDVNQVQVDGNAECDGFVDGLVKSVGWFDYCLPSIPAGSRGKKGKSTHPELPDKLLNRILQHITQLLASLEQGQSICFSQLGGTLGRCVEDLLRE
jgi:hypothetical protein